MYDRSKDENQLRLQKKIFKDLLYIAAMGPPGMTR